MRANEFIEAVKNALEEREPDTSLLVKLNDLNHVVLYMEGQTELVRLKEERIKKLESELKFYKDCYKRLDDYV